MFRIFLIVIFFCSSLVNVSKANFDVKARTAILQDYHSEEILYEKEPDISIYPASMTKIMTAIIAFDLIKSGDLSLDEKFIISERAWRLSTSGYSSMFIMVGDQVSVENLLRGIIVASGNDACIALAEGIAGTEEEFAILMTAKAKELEMDNTNFSNSLALAVIKIANSSSVPAIPSANATHASFPDAIIIPFNKSSTPTSSPTITNIDEDPGSDNRQAFSEIKNFSSKLRSPDLIKSNATIAVIIFVIEAG